MKGYKSPGRRATRDACAGVVVWKSRTTRQDEDDRTVLQSWQYVRDYHGPIGAEKVLPNKLPRDA